MAIVYEGNGGLAAQSSGTSMDVAFPATVNADDILIMNLISRSSTEPETPAGWTVHSQATNGVFHGATLCWKRAAGTETGNQAVVVANVNSYGIITRYSGVRTYGKPYHDWNGLALTETASYLPINNVYQGGPWMCIAECFIFNDATLADDGGTYSEVAELSSTVGDDATWALYDHTPAGMGTVTGENITMSSQEYVSRIVLSLVPDTLPSYEGSGTIAAVVGTALNVNYPGTVDSGDILFCKLGSANNAVTWSTVVSGWTEIRDAGGGALYWKRATGSETGTALFTASGSTTQSGIVYRFAGCLETGTPYEQAAHQESTTDDIVIPALAGNTTSEGLLAAMSQISDDRLRNGGPDYYIKFAEQSSTVGSDAANHLCILPTGTGENPGSDMLEVYGFGYDEQSCSVLNILPATGGGPTGYANDVNTVGTAAIGKINGVATADIGKVNTA